MKDGAKSTTAFGRKVFQALSLFVLTTNFVVLFVT